MITQAGEQCPKRFELRLTGHLAANHARRREDRRFVQTSLHLLEQLCRLRGTETDRERPVLEPLRAVRGQLKVGQIKRHRGAFLRSDRSSSINLVRVGLLMASPKCSSLTSVEPEQLDRDHEPALRLQLGGRGLAVVRCQAGSCWQPRFGQPGRSDHWRRPPALVSGGGSGPVLHALAVAARALHRRLQHNNRRRSRIPCAARAVGRRQRGFLAGQGEYAGAVAIASPAWRRAPTAAHGFGSSTGRRLFGIGISWRSFGRRS